ncbi:Ca-activated chloride channel family protein [Alteribacillus persepolensis]|uniref:Ca-activated chloride channel family protein n=1 Tax=Alteribacillus persepolensis TaxID=568899 RepID=A0A1G8I116_9BACI|nr:VWA domain-containing protein [Alteribacillus persepolensis]SDI12441.1 Ca-activated chloride channel family protein [Alteribacillus persepolensis]
MSGGKIRQILLLTDGCSNQGEDPASVAAFAKEKGITVNVIGILEQGSQREHGMREVEDIAMAGGGVSQVVYANQLSQTVQMVTRQAMTQTLHGVVHNELRHILGNDQEMEDLPPDKRGEVMEVVDELGESVSLDVLILVDTSASMKPKFPMVQEALTDLSISLNSRSGENYFSLFVFPGKRKEVEKILNWTPQMNSLTNTFNRLTTGGVTPTGPALKAALYHVEKRKDRRSLIEYGEEDGSIEESGF